MGIETMYSVNVSQVATVSFEGVISDIGSKDPLSFATVQLLHGDEVHSILSKETEYFLFPLCIRATIYCVLLMWDTIVMKNGLH